MASQGEVVPEKPTPGSRAGVRLGSAILENQKLKELEELQAERRRRVGYRKFETYAASYSPDYVHPETGEKDGYAKHRRLMESKTTTSSAMSSNRCGKSAAGAFETTCHATGNYPSWWNGIRFDKPVSIWVAGITAKST